MKRPCLQCGRPTESKTRCTECAAAHQHHRDQLRGSPAQRGYGHGWRQRRQAAIEAWVEANGWVCPGWAVPPHDVAPGALTGDHVIPLALGGRDSAIQPLCRPCNGRKGKKLPGVTEVS